MPCRTRCRNRPTSACTVVRAVPRRRPRPAPSSAPAAVSCRRCSALARSLAGSNPSSSARTAACIAAIEASSCRRMSRSASATASSGAMSVRRPAPSRAASASSSSAENFSGLLPRALDHRLLDAELALDAGARDQGYRSPLTVRAAAPTRSKVFLRIRQGLSRHPDAAQRLPPGPRRRPPCGRRRRWSSPASVAARGLVLLAVAAAAAVAPLAASRPALRHPSRPGMMATGGAGGRRFKRRCMVRLRAGERLLIGAPGDRSPAAGSANR